jgi:hypothetical protein
MTLQLLGFAEGTYVAALYVVIGLAVLRNIAPTQLALIGGALFFLGCALTHLDLAIHAFLAIATEWHWQDEWHMHVAHLMQMVGGTVFVLEVIGDGNALSVVNPWFSKRAGQDSDDLAESVEEIREGVEDIQKTLDEESEERRGRENF